MTRAAAIATLTKMEAALEAELASLDSLTQTDKFLGVWEDLEVVRRFLKAEEEEVEGA